MYVPEAVVDHLVPADRATLRAVVARCYHEGRGKVELARVIGDSGMFGIERELHATGAAEGVRAGAGRDRHAVVGSVHASRSFVLLGGRRDRRGRRGRRDACADGRPRCPMGA